MATRHLLTDLVSRFESTSPRPVALESIGGVDAAKRVKAGEAFDAVVLSADAIDQLIAGGHIVAGSRVDLVRSPVAIAVRAGAPRPDVSSEEALKRAVVGAGSVAYSTGPSGTFLARLFAGWGIADALKDRITVAPPGVPVGSLVARGEVELGFQQLSELVALEGIDVVGPMPEPVQVITIFSGGVAATSTQPDSARELLQFMGGSAFADVKRQHGMEPA
jgi:molybdate transport system substrate-binding protein